MSATPAPETTPAPATPSSAATPPGSADELARLPGYDPDGPVLRLSELQIKFRYRRAESCVVDGVSYEVAAGKTMAVVGESGCGKSMSVRAAMGILPPRAAVTAGTIHLHGVDLLRLERRRLQRLRGRRLAMIFQEPLSALNPVLPVGYQVAEVFRAHERIGRAAAARRAVEMLDRVGIPAAKQRASDYPHQLSGGMRQRAMIAMALALAPDVLIADEPTTALDVTVQAQIIELLANLQRESGMALVLISHDMGVIADVADQVAVMYAGRIVERAPTAALFAEPRHPYTRALIDAIPRRGSRGKTLTVLPGAPPDPARMPAGCPFQPRCPLAEGRCAEEAPPPQLVGARHESCCHRWAEVTGS
ncbi:MAG: ABC transporter ATP-binding protein [Actinomycetia bacterium]|nr:ABC transporter ATP-binding protein [Actinomycetes bacterium]